MSGNTFLVKDILGERCVSFLPMIDLHHKPREGCLCVCISWSFLRSLDTAPASQAGDGMQHWHWHRALTRQPAGDSSKGSHTPP